jgi:3'(2'), 5'-bisphosphate nucleotidase
MSYAYERQIAIEATTCAAQLCRAVRAEMPTIEVLQKCDESPVTVADFGSQALIGQRLATAFPGDSIVSEEHAAVLRQPSGTSMLAQVVQYVQRLEPRATPEQVCHWIDASKGAVAQRFWALDPIDGTKGFLRGGQYAIALALIEGDRVRAAVLGCPALPLNINRPDDQVGVLFVAVQGEGTMMAPLGSDSFEPIHVGPGVDGQNLRLVESVEAAHGDPMRQEAVARAVHITAPALRMDSQAKYGVVARGDVALYLRLPSPDRPDYRENIWDHAAGSLIVEEAGGRVSDMCGNLLDFASDVRMHHNRGVVVSNGILHEEVLAVLARA